MKNEESKKIIMFPEFWDELTEKDWKDMLLLRQRLIDDPREGVDVSDVRNEAARCLLLNRGLKPVQAMTSISSL